MRILQKKGHTKEQCRKLQRKEHENKAKVAEHKCQIPNVNKQSLSIVSSPSISELSYSSLFYCELDPNIHVYNIENVSGQLTYFEQQIDKILNYFHDVFPSELPHGLPPKRNIDHRIDIVPRVTPISIPPYSLS